MNPEELVEGALHATCQVAEAMATGNLESVESLMTSECLAGAREQLAELRPGQRFGLEVIREDVLASWIEQSGEGRLLLVVTSLPGKGWIMRNQELSEERYIEFVKKLKEGGPHDRRYIRMEKERWKDDFCRRHGVRPKFEKMDFFVSNVEFTHDEPSSSWRISSLSTKSGNSLELSRYSSFRWRSHISYTLVNKDMPLIALLRYDMAYDLAMIMVLLLFPILLLRYR